MQISFLTGFLKANPGKCHLLVDTTGNIKISVKNEAISNSLKKKLLGIRFNISFCFDDQVASLCKKTSQNLNAFRRVARYMNLAQRKSIMKTFICSQFWILSIVYWILSIP